MSNDDRRRQREDSLEDLKKTNERRIEELLNINNKYVRTQRHLEEHKDIASLDQLQHAFEVQKDREERMENLKDLIVNGAQDREDNIEALEKRIAYTNGYLDHNKDHMDDITLENAVQKQENRKEQLENLLE
ncbi:hypothetical protein [Lutispora thermophila]|uniref:Uncharacterized protein n=1 Tax=Lutispora thermophila DSM 19022 TaxID=1122184 RepID=A0A1M6H1U3_9FIRM|nr:hypothetical protein [Lutispora thermophila]SHJ16161.1 hypothetical protein SAMN02745176_02608 [Lutispora thermophila DSM 19022]